MAADDPRTTPAAAGARALDRAPGHAPDRAPSRANRVAAVVLVLLVAGVAALGLAPTLAPRDAGLCAVIHASDGSVTRLPLDEDVTVTIATDKGANTVTVADGAVFVEDADCDGQDCLRQGSLDAPGRQIICLPHELWIEVAADGEGMDGLDASAVAGGEGAATAAGLDGVSR